MSEKFSVGLAQMSCSLAPDENLAKAQRRIREAAGRGAQIVCLQELFRSQYFCREENAELFSLAELVPGPSTQALSKLARELEVVIIAPLFEKRAAGVYHNTAAVIDADGSLLGLYRKMHIPDDPLYYEKFYFTPGDLGFPNFDTRYGRIGVLICWDQWYPEAARLASLRGAKRCLAHRPTRARHRKWRLHRRRQPRRLRGPRGQRARILGGLVCRRSLRTDARGSTHAQRRDARGGVRSAADGGSPPQLAVPARPPH